MTDFEIEKLKQLVVNNFPIYYRGDGDKVYLDNDKVSSIVTTSSEIYAKLDDGVCIDLEKYSPDDFVVMTPFMLA